MGRLTLSVKSFLSIVISILIGSAYSWFWPEVKLNPLESIDPKNPFYNIFQIVNTTIIPIYSVRPEFIIDALRTAAGGGITNIATMPTEEIISNIGTHDIYPFYYNLNHTIAAFGQQNVVKLTIAIQIQYHYLGINCSDSFYYQCIQKKNGEWSWYAKSWPDDIPKPVREYGFYWWQQLGKELY